MEVFGIHSFSENLYSGDDLSFGESYYDAQNVLNVLGWFPLLGTVIGTIRVVGTGIMYLSDAESFRHEHKKYYTVSVIRGIVEMFSLGFIFLIPDLIASFRRKRRIRIRQRKMRENKVKSVV